MSSEFITTHSTAEAHNLTKTARSWFSIVVQIPFADVPNTIGCDIASDKTQSAALPWRRKQDSRQPQCATIHVTNPRS
jgi:hypothetical protein